MCLSISIYLSIYLFIHLSIYLKFIFLFIYLFIYSTYLSVDLFIYLFIHLFIYLFTYLFIYIHGNLDVSSVSWKCLMELYQQGLISATISGHPCETFSSACWHEPPEEFRHIKWPRPLRTAERLFGLDHRTWRELQKTRLGTSFFLQTVWVLACHVGPCCLWMLMVVCSLKNIPAFPFMITNSLFGVVIVVPLWNSLDNTQIFDCIRLGTGALRRLQICMLLLIHLLGNLTRSQSALVLAVPSAPVCTKSIHLGCRRVLPLPSPNS